MLTDELLRFIQEEKNISMKFVKEAQKRGKGVYLYGAGHHLRFAVQFMQKYKINIKAILDTNREGEYCGIPIIRFAEFMRSEPDQDSWFVISAPSVSEEITAVLSDSLPRENIFSFEMEFYLDYIPDVEEYREYLLSHWKELSAFSEQLSDDHSRKTLEDVLKGRISGEIKYFRQCYVPDQYYPNDIIHLGKGEVMVELGANNGETLEEFLRLCPDYHAVYCFEPDTNCLPILNGIKKKTGREGTIHIVPKGAWDCAEVLEFCSDGECAGNAHIVVGRGGNASFQIETATVDAEVSEPVSFLKMDIEGAELRALHGAEQQITENHPKLAVCVYHRIDDILNIWNYLRELIPEYRFYLRHHNRSAATETVLYAVGAGKSIEPEIGDT